MKGEPRAAAEAELEAIGLDPYRQRNYRCLIRGYASTGNRAKVVETDHRFRGLLAEELGTEPKPETRALYLKLLG